MKTEPQTPYDLKDTIRLVMLFCMTPKQEAEIKAAAAREGLPTLHYLYKLVLTESDRFSVPMIRPAPAPVS